MVKKKKKKKNSLYAFIEARPPPEISLKITSSLF